MADKFWMVWRDGDKNPSRKHPTVTEAINEARRLAEQHPNNHFYVMEPMVRYCGDITVSSVSLSNGGKSDGK